MDGFSKQAPLDRLTILAEAPEDSGVYVLESEEGRILFIDWADNLAQALRAHLPESTKDPLLRRQAKYYRVMNTTQRERLVQIFDEFVELEKAFPVGNREAPHGSRWYGEADPGSARDKAVSAAAQQQTEALPSSPGTVAQAKEIPFNVLVVDDEPQVLILVKEFLEMEGFTVFAAANEREAAQIALKKPIAVALLDYRLGNVTAEKLLLALKKHHPEVHLMIITADSNKEGIYGLLRLGVSKIFPKPFSMKLLVRAISEVKDRRVFS